MTQTRGLLATWLIALLACAALPAAPNTSPEDLDRQWMAEYLAQHRGLYTDARDLAAKITDSSLRQVTTARVLLFEAEGADEVKQRELRSQALGLLENLKSDDGKLARVQVMLDIAKANGPTRSDSSSILRAIDLVKDLREDINKRAALDFNFFDRNRPTPIYETFVGTFYEEMRAFYMLAELEAPYSDARAQRVNSLTNAFGDLTFEQLHWTKAEFDAYILNGEAQVLAGDIDMAVIRFLDLPVALSMMPVGHPVVREQSLRGYVSAVEVQMDHRSSDPAAMRRVRSEIAKALSTYPGARDTFLGKQLIIYDTAASIRLGGEAAPALEVLYGLVEDENFALRRRAAGQLAELALSPTLTLAQRHKCIVKVTAVRDYELMLLASQAMHSMLASLTTIQEYEAYAPYLFVTLGSTYEAMSRFMDASLIYREGAERLRYWRDQNADWEGSDAALPRHMLDAEGNPICNVEFGGATFRLKTRGDAFEISRQLAERAKVNAEWLTSRAHGDPSSAALGAFRTDVDRWYLPFAGAEQRFVEVRQAGYRKFNESRRQPNGMVEAAVLLLSTPASDRAAVTASYFAGTGLIEAYSQPAIPQIVWPQGLTRDDFFGTGTYTLQGIQFDGQRKRIEAELTRLPAGVRAEQLALLDKLSGPGAITDRREYLWTFAQFALRQSLVFQMLTDTSGMAALEEPVTLAIAYDAFCDSANERFLSSPEGGRQPSSAMMQAARTVAQLVFALRNPQADITDPVAKRTAEAEMVARGRTTVRELLRTSWRNHGPHLDAALSTMDGEERAQVVTVMRALVIGLFRENVDSGRVAEAQDAFEAFRRRFAANVTPDSEEGRQLVNMAGEVYNALLRFERPRADALLFAARTLDAIGVMLGKPVQSDAFARQTAGLEQDAWAALPIGERRAKTAEYIRNRVNSEVFGPEAVMRVRTSGAVESRPLAQVLPSDEATRFAEQWAKWEEQYTGILREGGTATLTAQIAAAPAGAGKTALEHALAMIPTEGVDAAAAWLHVQSREMPQDDLAAVAIVTGAAFRLTTVAEELGFGNGHAFRSEVRQYLEARSAALRRLARAPMERFLDGNTTLREMRGEPLFTAANADTMAESFSIVGDLANAHAAWKLWFESKRESYGDPSFIPVNSERRSLLNDNDRADEIRVRLELAQSSLALARIERNAANRATLINEGLHHARRLLQIMQWRDAVVQFDRDRAWATNLENSATGRVIDRAYVPTQQVYAGLLTICADLGLKPQWEVKYYAQFWRWLSREDVEREATEAQRYYKLPVEQAELLADAAQAWWTLSAFGNQAGGFYNHFYRQAYPGWADAKLKEANVHARAGRNAEKDAAAGTVVRNAWSEWDRRRNAAFDDASREYVKQLRSIYEEARKLVSIEWMRANAANILEREAAGSQGTQGSSSQGGTE